MNTNPLLNQVTGTGTVNALETIDPKTLKVSLDEIYKMLVKAGYRKVSCDIRLMSKNFCKYHKKRVM
jgi:hypothetical protein